MKKNQQDILQRSIYKIRSYRIDKGLSQSEFSDLIGISNRKYQRIEAFESVPDLELLYRISNVLDVNFDQLFSPNLHQTQIEGIYFYPNKEDFFNDPEVKNSNFESILTSELCDTFSNFTQAKEILKNPLFKSFDSALTFSDYTTNCFNDKAMEFYDQKVEILEHPSAFYNMKTLIMLWDMVYIDVLKYGLFKYKIPALYSKNGEEKFAYSCGKINHSGKIFILSLIK